LMLRCVVLIAALIASGGLLELLLRRLNRRQIDAQQFLDRISELASTGQGASTSLEGLLLLDPRSSWTPTLHRVRDAFAAQLQRAADAEHGRSALEIRCRREAGESQRVREILDRINEPVL